MVTVVDAFNFFNDGSADKLVDRKLTDIERAIVNLLGSDIF